MGLHTFEFVFGKNKIWNGQVERIKIFLKSYNNEFFNRISKHFQQENNNSLAHVSCSLYFCVTIGVQEKWLRKIRVASGGNSNMGKSVRNVRIKKSFWRIKK